MNFLSLDIGTTCCKCRLFDERGGILYYHADEVALKTDGGENYADICAIVELVKGQIRGAADTAEVNSIAVSSFGESFVALDCADRVIWLPMLYTDPRGDEQAEKLKHDFGEDFMCRTTGVAPNAMYSLSKLLWLAQTLPEVFAKTEKVMLIGEYIGYILTGERVIDYGLAARTGAFDINKMTFRADILEKSGISPSLFSLPMPAGSIVGKVRAELAAELGLNGDCKVVLGSHDQVCATLGAGVVTAGEAADGMGTVECITAVFDGIPKSDMGKSGYPVVPYAVKGLYCTYILNYSCGSLVNWFRKGILHGYSGDKPNFYEYMEERLKGKPTEILALPYFGGAATPYCDVNAKGAFVGLTLGTSDAELYRAILEGTAFEMMLNLEKIAEYGVRVTRATATGGCSNSEGWLQIKSDITGLRLNSLKSHEGGLCGAAMLQAAALGAVKDLAEAKTIFVKYNKDFSPNAERAKRYAEIYKKYKTLYKTLKEYF